MILEKIKEATFDILCKYAYKGAIEHIKNAKTLETVKKMKESEALLDIRWFCEEEMARLNKTEEFKGLETDLEKAFSDKEHAFTYNY